VYFDTHCHLCSSAYAEDIEAVLLRAGNAGVSRILIPGTDIEDSTCGAVLAEGHSDLFAAAAIHPSEAAGIGQAEFSRIVRLQLEAGVIAVGESGLDLHWPDGPPLAVQTELLERHISLAEAFGVTLVLHSRDAEEELLELLGGPKSFPVVFHSYTGPGATAIRAAEMGFYIGLSGPLTYPANSELRSLAARLPRDRILVETDGPYLAPQPQRGRRNEPAFIEHTASVIAGIWGMDIESTADRLMSNSLEAFQLAPRRRTDLVYIMYGRIYLNITGLCGNRCDFCVRERTDGLAGYHLAHMGEPDPERLRKILALLEPEWASELVFCGYGEPTMRPELLRELAFTASEKGFRVRLNTNGLCLASLSRNETLDLLEPFDTVSVSLNSHSRENYESVCNPSDTSAWEHLLEFIHLAKTVCELRTTAVAHDGVDLSAVSALAEELGVPFRVRGS